MFDFEIIAFFITKKAKEFESQGKIIVWDWIDYSALLKCKLWIHENGSGWKLKWVLKLWLEEKIFLKIHGCDGDQASEMKVTGQDGS